jgi:Bifunctional DNA primase/polymerase, N-terminal/Family of unknown function (DUF5906)/Primase C terminal 2 (PriCT-2)
MSNLENENRRIGESDASEKSLGMIVASDTHENAETVLTTVPATHDPKALDAHVKAGHELIPINGKMPVEKGWRRTTPLSLDNAKARFAVGSNIGVRLRDTDLVIDVDPRHFAENDQPLDRLKADFSLPETPFVRTGGGGLHLYLRKPVDVLIVNALTEYAGIEFKSLGRQVVAAGSIHPDSGKPYSHDDDPLAVSLAEAPEAPTAFLDAIKKPSVSSSDNSFGEIEAERLGELLEMIDVTSYQEQTKWCDLMMACHHATGGSGVEEFIAWSVSDPEYSDHREKIIQRWNSLDNKPGAIAIATLIDALPKDKRREIIESIGRVSPTDDFPNDDVEVDSESSFSGWDEWVFVASAMQFIRREDGVKYRTDQWKALYGGLHPDGEILSAVWKSIIPIKKFEALVYLPEAPEFPYGENTGFYNIWRKSGVEAKFGDVKPFLDHMDFLFPNEADCELVFDYLALLTQKPADKIHFALLIRGAQGTGKSWIGNLMELIIGKPNVVRPSNDEVISKWTRWMEGSQLAVVEELMTLGRLVVANRLKPVITDSTIRIEEKNCSIYSIPNKLNFLCFTNHEDALKIEHGDRRWLVVFSPAVKQDAAYYERLFGYLAEGGAAYVKHWLLQRQVVLNGHGVAPPTSSKETMRRSSMGDAESYLLELFEGVEAPFDFDLVRVDDLIQVVPAKLVGRSNLRVRLAKFLKEELGAVNHTRYTKGDAKRPSYQLWSLRNHEVWEGIGAAGRIDAYVAHYAIDLAVD